MWKIGHLDDLATKLRRLFPTCGKIEPISILGHGFSSLAVESANGYVFLIARNGDSKYTSAIYFLKQVGDQLSVRVPYLKFSAPNVIGYRKLSGISLEDCLDTVPRKQLAIDVAKFLVALHSLSPPAKLPNMTWRDHRDIFHQRWQDTTKIIHEMMTITEVSMIENWWESFLVDERMAHHDSVVVHNDLWYGNMLVDDNGHLTAVIDWEMVAISDPAFDFVPQLYLGKAFDDYVIEAYQQHGGTIDQHLSYRIEQLRIVREFSGLQMAIKWNDQEEIQESINKIRQTPLFK